LAGVPTEAPDEMFPHQRFPTAGDLLGFSTTRGGPGAQVIELAQVTADTQTLGWGMSSLTLDPDRGFLYVTTKLDDIVYVLDVHDDTDGSFVDANALDLEALVQVDTGNLTAGFRDLVIARNRGLGILSGRNPSQLVVIDLDRIADDAAKEIVLSPAVAVLPMRDAAEDAGVDTFASFGGSRMALSADERMLLVPDFRGNGLSVFDLELGAWGQEIAWLPNLGENPHAVEISPDGRYAVVANYLGDVVNEFVSSTLVVVDIDPNSDRYLEAVTWLANR
jgi:DNA-binding beta-propeller fold protein YncE